MSTTEKAGTSLPQNSPELELFIQGQALIRAAARIFDSFTAHPLNHLTQKQQDNFRNLANEVRATCYEALDDSESLQFMFFAPFYPIDGEPNLPDYAVHQ